MWTAWQMDTLGGWGGSGGVIMKTAQLHLSLTSKKTTTMQCQPPVRGQKVERERLPTCQINLIENFCETWHCSHQDIHSVLKTVSVLEKKKMVAGDDTGDLLVGLIATNAVCFPFDRNNNVQLRLNKSSTLSKTPITHMVMKELNG